MIPKNKRVSIDALRMSELNQKREITEEDIKELADNLEKYGQLHPITVRPYGNGGHMYEVLAGRRRLTAMKLLGWDKVDVRVFDVDDIRAEIISYSENMKTKKPNSAEWDAGLARLVELHEQLQEAEAPKPYVPLYKGKSKKSSNSKELSDFCSKRRQKSDNQLKLKEKHKPAVKTGRPKSKKRQAISAVADSVGVHRETVRKALKRHADLTPSAARALELGTITKKQANELAAMSAKKQRETLRPMVIATREARERRKRSAGIKSAPNKLEVISDILSSAFIDFKSVRNKLDTAVQALAGTKGSLKPLSKTPNIQYAREVRDYLNTLLDVIPD